MAIDGTTHPACLRAYGLDGLTTVLTYTGVVKKVLKTIKYRFVYDEAESLIDLIPVSIWQLLKNLTHNYEIYPIPLHQDRLRWRGFNQAEKLAQAIGKRLEVPIIDGLLIRKETRKPQADIAKRDDRIKNAHGLFTFNSSLSDPPWVESRRVTKNMPSTGSGNKIHETSFISEHPSIILIDDVWTTGATMKEAAKALKRNGVTHVWAVTVAR